MNSSNLQTALRQHLPDTFLIHNWSYTLLHHTVSGGQTFSWGASNTAFQGGNLSPPQCLCVPAAEHSIWRCKCLMATALPPTQSLPLFSFFPSPSLNPFFLLYHFLPLFCAVDGDGRRIQLFLFYLRSGERPGRCIFLHEHPTQSEENNKLTQRKKAKG